jgi:ATP-dependent Clp protease protease subunit
MIRPSARYVLPEFTERTNFGSKTMDPYSKLLEERIVFLGTQIDDTSANDVMAQFMHLEYQDPDRDISLYINSPGGSLTAMSAIYDTMQFVGCDVETICMGQAGSSAAVLLAAGEPGRRLVLPHSRVVLHQPSGGGQGTLPDLALHAKEIVRLRSQMEEILSRHTGRDVAAIREDTDRDLVLDAEEAVAYGLADAVLDPRKGIVK